VCIVDEADKVIREVKVATEPRSVGAFYSRVSDANQTSWTP
jgi:hypothetical protein